MTLKHELLILAALVVATLAMAQALESGALDLSHLRQVITARS